MKGIKNLTEGHILKQLFALAMPIMATSFIQMAYSLTDMACYTAVTRARRMVIIVGRAEMIAEMVDNARQSMRYTGLARALKE